MLELRYEEYGNSTFETPFIFNIDLKRTKTQLSTKMNWHDDLEIQFCTKGNGSVLLDSVQYDFYEGDIVVVNSNVIHYSDTKDFIEYSALIINTGFLNQMGIDYERIEFSPIVKDEKIFSLLVLLKKIKRDDNISFKTARLNSILLEILVRLGDSYSSPKTKINSKSFERVKKTVKYIRENYNKKITLDDISKNVYADKYQLSRDFKKSTGQTIMEYANNYRCKQAKSLIRAGYNISEAANSCGFENMSFFSRTFRRYIGVLPSKVKAETERIK